YADDLIKFTVVGEGYVRGVGNGDPNSHESDILPQRRAFCGLCQALVTSKLGAKSIKIVAESASLAPCELELAVCSVKAPITPEPCNAVYLGNVTMSGVTMERPDALIELADNDQNSFMPVAFEEGSFQRDFYEGWRIYRATVKAASSAKYRLLLAKGMFSSLHVYVNGKTVIGSDSLNVYDQPYRTPSFEAKEGERLDIRILLRASLEFDDRGAGIMGGIYLEDVN
ncbi:MAG: hypothetical protein IJC64_01655, partial [Clostridia bacterium]|nr:hypothetical protein [Clostridia bacterium]